LEKESRIRQIEKNLFLLRFLRSKKICWKSS